MSDRRIHVRRFSESDEFVGAGCDLLSGEFADAGKDDRAVMLSGGSTPLPVYRKIAEEPVRAGPSVYVMYSDERMVDLDSADNNYSQSLIMLRAVGLSDDRILRVCTDYPLREAAEMYDRNLDRFTRSGGRITLGLLGLGSDGHTASLFSMEDIERGENRWAIPVRRSVGPDRVSVTGRLLRQIERIVFLVSGGEKRAMVDALINDPESIPAGRAVRGCENVELWFVE